MGLVNLDLIFKIAGVGIIVSVIQSLLKQTGKEEYAWIATLAGVATVMYWVVELVGDLFDKIKTIFRLF